MRPDVRVRLTPSALVPSAIGISVSEVRDAISFAAGEWTYPRIPCTSLRITVADPAPMRLAAEDGLNLVVFRERHWCHNERCGAKATFPLRAAAMTTTYPSDAVAPAVHEADIELNGVSISWSTSALKPGQVLLKSVMLHELGHVLGFADLDPLPAGARLDSVMRQGATAEVLTEEDVKNVCRMYPR